MQLQLLLWSSPAHSFPGQNPADLVSTFYCLRFETFPVWRARFPYFFPQEQGGTVIPPGAEFHFHSLLRLAGLAEQDTVGSVI
jgi:hypothetical protein